MGKSVCIATMTSGEYEWYIPMFLYCSQKAYPEYDTFVLSRTKTEMFDPFLEKNIFRGFKDDLPMTGLTTAAMRFLMGDEYFIDYDFTLITDVDVMLFREEPTLLEQHLSSMEKSGLSCYDNYEARDKSCIGVHFVTREWWDKTYKKRAEFLEKLKTDTQFKDYDEQMLYRLIIDSGLGKPSKEQKLWFNHGIHLGKWRGKNKPSIDAFESLQIKELMSDNIFNTLINYSTQYINGFDKVLKRLSEFGGQNAVCDKG